MAGLVTPPSPLELHRASTNRATPFSNPGNLLIFFKNQLGNRLCGGGGIFSFCTLVSALLPVNDFVSYGLD